MPSVVNYYFGHLKSPSIARARNIMSLTTNHGPPTAKCVKSDSPLPAIQNQKHRLSLRLMSQTPQANNKVATISRMFTMLNLPFPAMNCVTMSPASFVVIHKIQSQIQKTAAPAFRTDLFAVIASANRSPVGEISPVHKGRGGPRASCADKSPDRVGESNWVRRMGEIKFVIIVQAHV